MQDSGSGEATPIKNAARARNKKSPAHPTIAALVEAWATSSPWPIERSVAREATAAFGHLQPSDLNPLMVGALVATWRKRYAPRTAYSYRGRLAKLLRTLEAFGGHHINPPKVPFPPARATVARGEELHALLTTASPWLRLFILLYLQCGLRRSEALAVTPRTWDPDQHTVTIKVKGGRTRTAQLTPDVETLLQMAAPTTTDPDQPYIYALRGRPISKSGLGQAWTALKKRCEVNPLVTAHDLRRTAATILYTATKDLRVPQQLLGHQRLSSTLTYLAPMHPDEARKYSELLRFDHFKPKEGDKPQ